MHQRLAPAEIDAVLSPLADATPLPRRAYVDDGIFAFERDVLFGGSYAVVARESELAGPGDFVCAPLTPAGILATRGADLELHAFHNVCLHRAMPIALGNGCAARLVCPYHGWTYETGGRLLEAPHAPKSVLARSRRLRDVRVGAWQGFVFASLDAKAKSLESTLGEIPPWLTAGALASLLSVYRSAHVTRANWKLLVENFQESHHFPSVHPSLEALTPAARATSWGDEGPWLGGEMRLPSAGTVSTTGELGARRMVGERGVVRDAMLFPGLLTSLQPDYLLTYRLWPLSAAETRITFDILVHPASVGAAGGHRDLVEFWSRVNAEDRAVVERQQLGMASPGPEPLAYALVEDGVHAFDRLVARAHASAP